MPYYQNDTNSKKKNNEDDDEKYKGRQRRKMKEWMGKGKGEKNPYKIFVYIRLSI